MVHGAARKLDCPQSRSEGNTCKNMGILGLVTFAILALSYIASAATTPAKAHGKPMNITAYCNAVHNSDGRGPSWSAKYYPGPGQWWCEEATIMGPQMRGGRKRRVDPAKACLYMHRTSRIHTHKGLDYAKEANMHCGEYVGLAPSTADMQPASLTICNQTSEATIAVGVGYLARIGPPFNWTSTGYWPVERGKCWTFNLPDRPGLKGYRGDAHVFGFHPKAILAGKDRPLCARRGPGFRHSNAQEKGDCPDKGYTMMPTTRLYVRAGDNRHVFRD